MHSNMNKIFYLLVILALGYSYQSSYSEDYTITIDNVLVNGESVSPNYDDAIVISNKDSILFKYSVNPNKRDPILYRVLLIMGTDTSINTVNDLEVRFANLPQSDYIFKISAFDSNGNWQTDEEEVKFKVDNRLTTLISNLSNSKIQIEELKSKIRELENKDNTVSTISDIALIILIIVILVFVVLFIKNKPKKNKKFKLENKIIPSKEVVVSNSENIELAKENAELREELKILRLQIDKMQLNSRDLLKQNKGLRETLNLSDKSKKELEDLQKQKEELFAVIVHDIKNPASVIKGLVDLLTNYDSTASDFDDIMKDIAASSSRILMLSSEISKIMALEGTALKLEYEVVDMNDIAKDVFQRNKYSAGNKNLTYECLFDNNLPEITLDVLRIDEVMDNLVSNAIKYTDRNGSILIETLFDKDKNNIVFSVTDTGLGLSEEDIKGTFQKGATLSSKPTAGESATGLGLWIVKKMVEAHNGYVWVKSKKGEGSTFAFSIPVKRKIKTALVELEETA